jgi:RNA polymerase sigma-70 factor (ECF subfamily)
MNSDAIRGDGEEANLVLLHRCRMNDPEACSEFYSRYNRKIFSTAYRILGEESSAEDALQETMLNVYRGLAHFRGDSKISTWISRITVNVCLGILRRAKHRHFVDLEDDAARDLPAPVTPGVDPMEYAATEELRMLIETAFARMSPKQGEVVRLHDLEGYTIQEIARIIHCPAGTVKSRLFYGRQEFKDLFRNLTAGRQAKPTVQ